VQNSGEFDFYEILTYLDINSLSLEY